MAKRKNLSLRWMNHIPTCDLGDRVLAIGSFLPPGRHSGASIESPVAALIDAGSDNKATRVLTYRSQASPRSRRSAGVGGHRPFPAGARPPRRRPPFKSGRDRLPQRLALTSLTLSHRPNRLEQGGGPPPRARPPRARRGTTWGTKLSAAERTQLNLEHPSELRSPRFGLRTRYRTQEVAGSSPASSIPKKALLRPDFRRWSRTPEARPRGTAGDTKRPRANAARARDLGLVNSPRT
jgi:hypothetical protein